MVKTTFKYNPSQQSAEELEQTFVGRRDLLEGMLSELREQSKGGSRQHYVIIGPRGIGKTNLLLMIYYATKRDSDLATKWIPVRLAEESYSVLSLADFLLEILRALSAEVDGLDEQIRAINASSDDQAVIDRGTDLLRSIASSQGKGILVLVDNLDMILEDQMHDQMETHRLRSLLMAQDFITIVGTSPTLFNELTNYDSPLYNFFKIINLKELSAKEMEELIAKRLTMEGKPDQAEALAKYRPRLEAIRHLTGGNPRLLLMLHQMCEHGEIPEVKKALETLLDELTPYFKHRMESLAPQMRKVLDTLARSDHSLTPTEIAREARLDVKQVNVQLTRMKDEGLVTAAKPRGKRNAYYGISERLFGIWHKMRLSRKDRKEVYFLAEFFQAWYQADEMIALIVGLGEQFRAALASDDQREVQHIVESLFILEGAANDTEVRTEVVNQQVRILLQLGKPDEALHKQKEYLALLEGENESLRKESRVLRGELRLAVRNRLRRAQSALATLTQPEKDWSSHFWAFQPRQKGPSKKAMYSSVHIGRAVGALTMVKEPFGVLGDIETTAHASLCCAWWLCALGRFSVASVAYRTAAEKAAASGDEELAQMARASGVASCILAERVEPADSPDVLNAREFWITQPQEQRPWSVVLTMALLWLGTEVGVRSPGGLPDLPLVGEVGSPLDAFLRAASDAVALGNAADCEQLAAELGDNRMRFAEHLAEHWRSNQPFYAWVAGALGLPERERLAAGKPVAP